MKVDAFLGLITTTEPEFLLVRVYPWRNTCDYFLLKLSLHFFFCRSFLTGVFMGHIAFSGSHYFLSLFLLVITTHWVGSRGEKTSFCTREVLRAVRFGLCFSFLFILIYIPFPALLAVKNVKTELRNLSLNDRRRGGGGTVYI